MGVSDLADLMDEAEAAMAGGRRMRAALTIAGGAFMFIGGVMYGSQLGGRANAALVLASLGIAALSIDAIFRLGPGTLNDPDAAERPGPRRAYPEPKLGPMEYCAKEPCPRT